MSISLKVFATIHLMLFTLASCSSSVQPINPLKSTITQNKYGSKNTPMPRLSLSAQPTVHRSNSSHQLEESNEIDVTKKPTRDSGSRSNDESVTKSGDDKKPRKPKSSSITSAKTPATKEQNANTTDSMNSVKPNDQNAQKNYLRRIYDFLRFNRNSTPPDTSQSEPVDDDSSSNFSSEDSQQEVQDKRNTGKNTKQVPVDDETPLVPLLRQLEKEQREEMKKKKYRDLDEYNLSHFCENDPESNQDTQDIRKNGSDVASQELSQSSTDDAKPTETTEDMDETDSTQSIKSSKDQYLKIPKDQGRTVERPVIYKKNFVRCLSPRQNYRSAYHSNVVRS